MIKYFISIIKYFMPLPKRKNGRNFCLNDNRYCFGIYKTIGGECGSRDFCERMYKAKNFGSDIEKLVI